MLGPSETAPLAAIWDRQLERHGVPEHLFDALLDRAVDARLAALKRGEDAPQFSVELILQVYEQYKSENRRTDADYQEWLRQFDQMEAVPTWK